MMDLVVTLNRFLKSIGAITVSDEDLELQAAYRSLPRDEREILWRTLHDGETVEDASVGMGLEKSAGRDLFLRAIEHLKSSDVPLGVE
jgi:DNA-directed RNA polymerase specialized sigma24 family protein